MIVAEHAKYVHHPALSLAKHFSMHHAVTQGFVFHLLHWKWSISRCLNSFL